MTQVATNNYNALVDFFAKFPEYAKNDFYITGESYGGIYIPTLSIKILEAKNMKLKAHQVQSPNPPINLKVSFNHSYEIQRHHNDNKTKLASKLY